MQHNIPIGRLINTEMVSNQARGAITPLELEYKYDPATHDFHTKDEIVEIMYSKKTADAGGYPNQKLNEFVSKKAEEILSDVKAENVSRDDNTTVEIFITKKQ